MHRLKQEIIKSLDIIDHSKVQNEVIQFLANQVEGLEHCFDFENFFNGESELEDWEIHAAWYLENNDISFSSRELVLLLNGLGNYYTIIKHDPKLGKKHFENALKIQKNLSEKDNLLTAVILDNLRFSYFQMDEVKTAEKLSKQALSLCETEADASRLQYRILTSLGLTHIRLSSPETALIYFNKSWEVLKTISSDGQELEKAETLKFLGACAHLMGELSKSLELEFDALKWNCEFYSGKPNIQKFYITREIGIAYRKMKCFKESLNWFLQAYKIEEAIYGKETNHYSPYLMCNLAETYCLLKKYRKAHYFADKALEIAKQRFKEKPHEIKPYSMSLKGDIYRATKKGKKALHYYEKSLEELSKIEYSSKYVDLPELRDKINTLSKETR